ncbi:MAG: sugar ABC transporter substrate-binding protein [Firmicutes bacterium]|nr:sugar ABC transporter substrate-binding protein [Bacillota bacterium]
MKKFALFTFVLVLLLPLLGTAMAKTSLEVWIMQPGNQDVEKLLAQAKADFQAKNPEVEVNLQFVPWLSAWQKITTAVAGGEAPDVCELGTTMTPFYADMGALLDMTKYVQAWGYAKDLDPGVLESAVMDEKLFGVPWYAGARALVYRKDWFAEAGIKSPPKTWDEFLAAAKAIQQVDKNGKVIRYGFAFQGNGRLTWLPFIWQNGGEIGYKKDGKWVSGMNSPEAIEAIRFYADLLLKHKLSPEASVTWSALNARQAFALGTCGMLIEGPWGLPPIYNANPEIASKIGVCLLPGKKKMATFVGGSNLVVFKQSRQKDLAAEFVHLLMGDKYQLELAKMLKFFPGRVSLQDDTAFKSDPILKVFAEQMKYGRSLPAAPGWGSIEKLDVPGVMLQKILTGQMSVEQAAAWAAEKMNDLFNP